MECAKYGISDPLNLLLFQVWPDMRSGLQAAPCSSGARIWEGSAARAFGMRRLRLARLPDRACASGRRLHPERAGQGRAAQSAIQDQALLSAAAELAMPFARRSRSFAPYGQTLNRFPGEHASAHAAAFVRILLSFE